MLEVTAAAQRYLATLRQARGADHRAAARLVSRRGRLGLAFALKPADDHRVVDGDAIDVHVPRAIDDALSAAVLDIESEHGQPTLVMRPRDTIRRSRPGR